MDCLSERIRNVAAMALRYLWVYFQELFQHLLNGERKSPCHRAHFPGGRDEFNPPYIFLRDYLGIDPTQTVYTFSEHIINPVMVTHIIFSLVFAIGYCVVAEIFPKVKLWQGILAGLIVTVAVHGIFCPALNLTPPLTQLPFDEYASEILGHIFWFWIIEIMRRDLRNRITHEPDPEVAIR